MIRMHVRHGTAWRHHRLLLGRVATWKALNIIMYVYSSTVFSPISDCFFFFFFGKGGHILTGVFFFFAQTKKRNLLTTRGKRNMYPMGAGQGGSAGTGRGGAGRVVAFVGPPGLHAQLSRSVLY